MPRQHRTQANISDFEECDDAANDSNIKISNSRQARSHKILATKQQALEIDSDSDNELVQVDKVFCVFCLIFMCIGILFYFFLVLWNMCAYHSF